MAESIPRMMKAISITEAGGPAVLAEIDFPVPRPGPAEVLIRVAAAGVNRPDVLQRLGRYPVPPDASPLPGLEVAGDIVAVGSAVTRWKAGDQVMALTHGGGYAEYCVVYGGHCLPIPAGLSFIEAAAVPETFFTVWYNVFMRGRLRYGETFMVHGGSSGIGTTAIQLARAHGCRVLTTAGSDEKCGFCERLGADRHSITAAKTGRPVFTKRPAVVASMSCSTWWPAPTRRRISSRWRGTAAAPSSPSLRGPGLNSICASC
mgnify:CR=1 FL=1